jgi:hypothetical protein
MRRLCLLALGVLFGALAVSGQEARDGDALSREIDRLKKLLAERIRERTPPEEEQLVHRTYDVADLITVIRDQPQPFDDLFPSGYVPPEPEMSEGCGPFEIDVLIDMIRTGIDPEYWETEGTDIQPRNGRLFVTAIPRLHRKIERNLGWCRQAIDRRVSVEVAAVPVAAEDAALVSGVVDLSADEAQRLLARSVGAVTLAGWDGQILGGRTGREIAYVRDIDVRAVEGKAVPDPVTARVFAGASAQVQACLDEGQGALVQCRLEFSGIKEPLPSHATPHGNIEVPTKRLTRVQASFWAPLGRTVVAGGCTVGDEPCVILVTVRRR